MDTKKIDEIKQKVRELYYSPNPDDGDLDEIEELLDQLKYEDLM